MPLSFAVHPASTLHSQVVTWFDDAARPLPWRAADRTPWGVLVSEVMLQQTPVSRVMPVWLAWLTRWPTPSDLADAPTADVLRAWGRLGYPRRALRLAECARALVEHHDARVPEDRELLLALPGVGEYTAAAVMAFAHGRRAVVVDTNVRRVLARALGGTALPAPSPTAAERRIAESMVPAGDAPAVAWAAASMELGALVCTARTPHCSACPIADLCAWRAAGYPPDSESHRRRAQPWHGTDRQVRGRIMATLRATPEVLSAAQLAALCADAEQLERCVYSLIADGLMEHGTGGYQLPGATAGTGGILTPLEARPASSTAPGWPTRDTESA